jgi:cation diffusion facilitator CzcD-associated flavoprotein CzcO
LPRDLFVLPIRTWAIFHRRLLLPARVVDFINAPVLRLALGSMESLGLRRASRGPSQMVAEDGRIPLIDVGTLGKIRDGSIKIRGAIDRLTNDGVVFDDERGEAYDAIVLATGFHPDLRRLIGDVDGVLDAHGTPRVTGQATDVPGLYFCGQIVSPTGQLREIGLEAERLAKVARQYLAARHDAA